MPRHVSHGFEVTGMEWASDFASIRLQTILPMEPWHRIRFPLAWENGPSMTTPRQTMLLTRTMGVEGPNVTRPACNATSARNAFPFSGFEGHPLPCETLNIVQVAY